MRTTVTADDRDNSAISGGDMKVTLLRDAGLVCIITGVLFMLMDQPMAVGNRSSFALAGWLATGCGIVARLLWVWSLSAAAARDRREQARRRFDVSPPSGRPPTSG